MSDKKGLILSHSQKEMYMSCPKKWELHYREKLRSTKIGSALFFGNALDSALNRLLLEKKSELTEEEQTILDQPIEKVFYDELSYATILGKKVSIVHSTSPVYYKSDVQLDILEAADIGKICAYAKEESISLRVYGDIEQFVSEAQTQAKKGLDDPTQKVYNYICWLSLYRKGLMMIEAYKANIFPQIEEVFEVQKKISLKDNNDEYVGYIDTICSFKDEPGVKYISDNKSSSRAYKEDSVRTSEQLASYAEAEGINKCAYLVVEKKLRKREPRVRWQIVRDTIPQDTIDTTFDKISETFYGIKEERFDKDFDSCYAYGQKCAYFGNCRTGSMKDLEYVNKEKDNVIEQDEGRVSRGESTSKDQS